MPRCSWGVVLLLGLLACSSQVETTPVGGSGGAGGGDAGGADAGACTPGSTTTCICHQGGTEGTRTCLPDGSDFGPCEGACKCPQGRGDGCCPGDGICCSCIPCGSDPFDPGPAGDPFIACVCQADVCADACVVECGGNGIGAACQACAATAATGACQLQAQACEAP